MTKHCAGTARDWERND